MNSGDKWIGTIVEHFESQLEPKLEQKGETLDGIHPMRFFWSGGSEYKQGMLDSRPYVYEYGTFGTGYLAHTDRALYIVSFQELTKEQPLFSSGVSGFVGDLLRTMSGTHRSFRPLKKDIVKTIPLDSIEGADIVESEHGTTLRVRTSVEVIDLHSLAHRVDFYEQILDGIREFKRSYPAKAAEQETPSSDPPTTSDDFSRMINMINELNVLVDSGDIPTEVRKGRPAEQVADETLLFLRTLREYDFISESEFLAQENALLALKQSKQMLKQGTITQEAYERKKREVITGLEAFFQEMWN